MLIVYLDPFSSYIQIMVEEVVSIKVFIETVSLDFFKIPNILSNETVVILKSIL